MKAELESSNLEARGSTGTPQRSPLRSHRDLEAYQRSLDLLVKIHEICKRLPPEERYDLGNQMRRARKSIPANIAEGFGRKASEKEFKQYMKMAMASANAMETHLKVAGRLGYVGREDLDALADGYTYRTTTSPANCKLEALLRSVELRASSFEQGGRHGL